MLTVDAKKALAIMEKTNHIQSSWDWESDLLFSEATQNGDAKIIRSAMASSAPRANIIGVWKSTWYKTTTKPRLKALRELVKSGKVSAHWSGMGPGAVNQFGTSRARTYHLINRK